MMIMQEEYEDDPIRSLPIHEVEDYHFLESPELEDCDLVLERNNVSIFGQPTGDYDGSLKSFMDLPIHDLEQPHFLEKNVSVFGQPAGGWRDEKSVIKVVTPDSEIHTNSSEDTSDDEDEDEKNWISEDDDIDALIASEMNKMTMKEREEAMFDVHGVSEVIEEAPDMVARKFDELESILAKKRSNKKAAAYNLALSMSPDYVHNRKFLLSFLRADRFHAKKAACRVRSHFHKKLELFGASTLCKDITLKDLNPSTMEVLETGHCTLLPARDRADRLVFFCDGPRKRYKDPIDQVRAMFYIFMSCAQDEEVQKRGIVGIGYLIGSLASLGLDRSLMKHCMRLMPAMPILVASLHQCYSDFRLSPILKLATYSANAFMRTRIRSHKGCHKEVQQELATFGILPQSLPVSGEGELKLENHREWLQMRRAVEEVVEPADETTKASIITPSRYDILFGRGRPIRENPGNVGLLFLVEQKSLVYEAADKQEKTRIALEIVRMQKAKPSRFLKKNASGVWEEVDADMAREKVSHAFRTMRAPPKQKVESTTKARIVTDEDAEKQESSKRADSLGKRAKRA